MSLLRALFTVGGLTLLSRVFGLVRDILTAGILGAGPVADAFFVALKLPNFFRRLFAEGAFSVSFVPLYAGLLDRRGAAAARGFAERVLAVMVAGLVPLTVLAVIGMEAIITVIAPGFADGDARFDQAVAYARITFPYLFCMSLVALLGGILNSHGRYGPFAAAPVLFNLCLILALLGLADPVGDGGLALAYGVALAGVAQMAFMAVCLARAGLDLRLGPPRLGPQVRRLGRLMAPGAFGAGVMQINLFIDVVLASFLPAGAITYLYLADRLYQLPLGVIGIALGTAVLPMLSRQVQETGPDRAVETLNRAVELGLLLALPAAVGLMVIPVEILAVLFENGAFDRDATQQTAAALMAYATGVPAYVLVKVFSQAYFARQDTVGPVKVAVAVTVVNTALSLALIGPLGHVGIALATGLTAWLNAGLLYWGLARSGRIRPDRQLLGVLPRLALALAAMAAGLVLARHGMAAPDSLLGLTGLLAAACACYFGTAVAVGAISARRLRSFRQQ